MNLRVWTIFSILFCSLWQLSAQTIKQEIYKTSENDVLYDFVRTPDNGHLLLGNVREMWTGGADIFLVKTNEDGSVAWGKTYGGDYDDTGIDIRMTFDGNYFIAGQTFSFGDSGGALYALMVDDSGELLWSKSLGFNSWTFVYDVSEQLANGDFVIAGSKNSIGGYGKEMFLCRMDQDGNFIWFKTYNAGFDNDWAYDLSVYDNGDLLLCGRLNYTSDAGYMGLMKVNQDGEMLWAKTYNSIGFGLLRETAIDESGSIFAVGRYDQFGYGEYESVLLKLDANGNVIWAKQYDGGGFDFTTEIRITGSGDLLFAGTSDSYGLGDRDLFMMKVDDEGEFVWGKAYGGPDTDTHHGMSDFYINDDQSIVLRANSKSFSNGTSDIYLIHTDPDGNSGCNETNFEPSVSDFTTNVSIAYITVDSYSTGYTNTQVNDIDFEYELLCSDTLTTQVNYNPKERIAVKLIPNPARNVVLIETINFTEPAKYMVTSMQGEIVLRGSFIEENKEIEIAQLASGVYFLEVYNNRDHLIGSEKLVIP